MRSPDITEEETKRYAGVAIVIAASAHLRRAHMFEPFVIDLRMALTRRA
jgi:hypothetical protein